MNKLLLVFVAALMTSGAFAQTGDKPTAGTFGLTAEVSYGSHSVGAVYYATPNLVIAPSLGFESTTEKVKTSTTSTDYPDSTPLIGAGLYYEIAPFEGLSFDLGPFLSYSNRTWKQSSGDTWTLSTLTLDANLIVKVQLTKNVAVFSTFGGYYQTTDQKDTTDSSANEYMYSYFGIQTGSLGITYYLR